jgi:hypothetical protein
MIAPQVDFYSSNLLGEVARDGVLLSRRDPSHALISVLFSVAWLEAVTNELIHVIRGGDERTDNVQGRRAALLVEAAKLDARSTSLETKLSVLCVAATGAALDSGSQPVQDVALLLDVRNHLVHTRPERRQTIQTSQEDENALINADFHKLYLRLESRGVIRRPSAPTVHFLTVALMSPEVAEWSVSTVKAMIILLSSWYPDLRSVLTPLLSPSSLDKPAS